MTELKPCPFCGAKAELHDYEGREDRCYYIQCPACHIGTQVMFFKGMVVERWNRRVDERVTIKKA